VNDGSSDNTAEVLSRYTTPVRVINQENNGLSAARNVALRDVQSDLLAFLDSDDSLPPHSIAERARVLEARPEFDVVYGDALLIDPQGKAIGKFTQFRGGERPSGNVFGALAYHNLSPPHTYMFRRKCLDTIGLFDESLDVLEDHDLWLRLAAQFRFYYVDNVVAHYQTHAQMMSLPQSPKLRLSDILIQERAIHNPAYANLTPQQQARVYTSLATKYAVQGDISIARGWFRQSMRHAPGYWPAYPRFVVTLLGKRGVWTVAKLVRMFNRRFRPITRWAYPP
jgi:glycosyltransferase involved in cell wall biosynthesis